jgi:hypothetical protein
MPVDDARHSIRDGTNQSRLTYRGTVDAHPDSQISTWLNVGEVKHGYPPPRLSVGSVTIAYCGAELVVEGACFDRPPRDACPLCALAWQNSKRPGRRWARAFRAFGA